MKYEKKDCVEYRVTSLEQITSVIIPHFDKYPLVTQKRADYLLFKEIIMMKNKKEHLTKTGLQKIVNLRAALNKGKLSKELKAAFPETKRVERPLVENQKIIDPQWLAGFSSAECCFAIEISYSHKYKLGLNVKLKYQVTQHIRDEKLIKSLINYLKCG